MADFQLQIHTQEKRVFDDRVTSIIVPAQNGYLGVLAALVSVVEQSLLVHPSRSLKLDVDLVLHAEPSDYVF